MKARPTEKGYRNEIRGYEKGEALIIAHTHDPSTVQGVDNKLGQLLR